ncbi:hypothetical protein HELRODRAFT_143239, partial [Helobdella robusta]|uniref:ISXO2-like transposase domain-containing protein n=1 Tax=Helobdella robusta TaxID=6412 RepID=T1EJ95_HELRO
TYYWSMGDISQAETASLLQIDENNTLPDWFNLHRQLCTDWVRDNPKIIGGPGRIVHIDESLVSSNKRTRNGRARLFRQRWLFGGIDNVSKEAFLEEVAQRDAATLLPIIQRHVLPGTTIWSDKWAAYANIPRVTGLAHDTVNHRYGCVAPNGVHTNAIENLWKCAKDKFK